MSETNKIEVGTVGWMDLTIENTEEVRDFYSKVTGWKHQPLSMGEYDDFIMLAPESEKPIAGVCHARGMNEGLPPQWLIYITVANLEKSMTLCKESGGKVIFGPKDAGQHGTFCVIQDPAGAVAGLFENKK